METNGNSKRKEEEGDEGGVSEEEYESDPEEDNLSLGMRRRKAASDDEDGGGEREEKEKDVGVSSDRIGNVRSDGSDSEGGAADREDEVVEELGSEEEEEEGVGYEEESGRGRGGDGGGTGNVEEEREGSEVVESNVVTEGENGNLVGDGGEGKKENEPFAVPTTGVFYMHDDRFSDNAGGRNRRTHGGRRLWESKDDKKWGHDKFQELTIEDRDHEQWGRSNSTSRYRGRGGKNRRPDSGYNKRSRNKSFNNGNNQNQEQQVLRGRGPRKYEPSMKSTGQGPPMQNRQPRKALGKTSPGSAEKASNPVGNAESDEVTPARKFSSLSSASPPFYPSGSSNKDVNIIQDREVQAGNTSKNLREPDTDENFSEQQTSRISRGKNITNSADLDRLYIDNSVAGGAAKPLSNVQMPLSGSSFPNTFNASQLKAQGMDQAISGQMSEQPTPPQNPVDRPTSQLSAVPRPAPSHAPCSVQASGQHPGSGSLSPPKTTLSMDSYEKGDVEAASDSNKSRTALVGKGKGNAQASGRGPFLLNGAQVVGATGNMGLGASDQNFPAFFPLIHLGGQHPGGIGVPAVGMAFPGYVGQPQVGGVGNSEMAWLPVLTGAAGALGATYCPPYIAVDGSYHARPSGPASMISSSSKESTANKFNNEWKLAQGPDIANNNESGQRQKPRRYSEMDFKQPSTST